MNKTSTQVPTVEELMAPPKKLRAWHLVALWVGSVLASPWIWAVAYSLLPHESPYWYATAASLTLIHFMQAVVAPWYDINYGNWSAFKKRVEGPTCPR